MSPSPCRLLTSSPPGAPPPDVGGLLFDKDAVYIDIPDWKVCVCGGGGG